MQYSFNLVFFLSSLRSFYRSSRIKIYISNRKNRKLYKHRRNPKKIFRANYKKNITITKKGEDLPNPPIGYREIKKDGLYFRRRGKNRSRRCNIKTRTPRNYPIQLFYIPRFYCLFLSRRTNKPRRNGRIRRIPHHAIHPFVRMCRLSKQQTKYFIFRMSTYCSLRFLRIRKMSTM